MAERPPAQLGASTSASSAACASSRPVLKRAERKVASPTKRQLTVHLYRNWRVSSNARLR
ncbi:hypothetical protein KEM52_005323 [Ascosphaera acerosa]|nr:hypothetical protein KEM52_005323 [Ascosphaera acerosa]